MVATIVGNIDKTKCSKCASECSYLGHQIFSAALFIHHWHQTNSCLGLTGTGKVRNSQHENKSTIRKGLAEGALGRSSSGIGKVKVLKMCLRQV